MKASLENQFPFGFNISVFEYCQSNEWMETDTKLDGGQYKDVTHEPALIDFWGYLRAV